MEWPSNAGGAPLHVGTGLERAIEEFKHICNVPIEIQSLITMVNRIRAVLKDAEEKQISSHAVRHCLWQGKEVLLDAEDLLDELTTDAAVQQMMGADRGEKVRTELGHHTYKKMPTMTSAMRRHIREINDRLDDLTPQIVMHGLHISTVEDSRFELSRRQQNSSLLPDETSVIGRDREKEDIIKMLLSSTQIAESSSNRGFSVLPIVGMGGMGKTTLAQLVFNDQRMKKHFELMMWVCVSNDFVLTRLTREMLDAAYAFKGKNAQYQITNWDSMQRRLLQEVEGKTFLLVLDDVWETDQFKWVELFKPLHFGKKGSKVLVTARSKASVDKIPGRMDPVQLGALSDADMWPLFQRYAFNGVTDADVTVSAEHLLHLEAIGRRIARRLKGSPLAARTIGSLLNTELRVQHWQTVLESRLWKLKQGEHDILPALALSYEYLRGDLKQCFAYCSLFPKDYALDREQVVQLWEAQCFIRMDRRTRKEVAENKYFDELLYRSFFEHASSWYGKNCYVTHDLIHDLAEYVSRDDCFRVEDQKSMEIPDTVRHISVCVTGFDQADLNILCKHVKLRSLVFLSTFEFVGLNPFTLDELFSKLKLLRVLGLQGRRIKELPGSIGDLKHLRYLDLSWNGDLENLPESLANLYNLQVLNLEGCESLRALPPRMSELINLRQLQAHDSLVSGIDELGKLTGLQELAVRGKKVRELGGMSMLRKLTIWELEEVGTKEEAIQARLHNMGCLQVLQLRWHDGNSPEAEEEVLQALRPNCGIEELLIGGYSGVRTPDWMEAPTLASLSLLRHLELVNCFNWQVLPSSLSQLHHLEVLMIKSMPKWEEWSRPPLWDGDHHPYSSQKNPSSSASLFFPCLRKLEIQYCPKLKKLPPFLPPTLRHLRLEGVGLSCLPEFWGSNRGGGGMEMTSSSHSPSVPAALSTLHILNCWSLTSVSGLLQHHLPSLEEIDIVDCKELVSLRERGLGHLVSLKKLRIERCPRLTCPPVMREEEHNPSQSQHLPCLLEQLHIERCGDAMGGWWWAGLQCLTSLTQLYLHGCPTTAESLFVSLGRHHHHPHLSVTLKKLEIHGCRCDHQLEYTTPTTSSSLPPPPPTRPSNPPLVDDASTGVIRALTSLTDFTINEIPNVLQKWGGGGLPSSLERLAISGDGGLDDEFLSTCLRDLTCLRSLSFKNFKNVRSLINLSRLSSLESLDIYDCPSIQSLSAMPVSLKHLTIKNLEDLCSLLNTLTCLSSLESLHIDGCPSIQSLPTMPTSLMNLTLHNFENLGSIPAMLSRISSLESLNIDGCPSIQLLPAMPTSLKNLTLHNLEKLRTLPDTLSCLSSLQHLRIGACHSIQSLPAMPTSLEDLTLGHFDKLRFLPDTLSCLSSLRQLRIGACPLIQSFPAMPTSLEDLTLWELPLFPDTLSCLSSLKSLHIYGCPSIQSLPAMPPSLVDLTLRGLENLWSLPGMLSCLSSLESLHIDGCPSIHSLPAMPPSLADLTLWDLKNIWSLPDMSSCLSSLQCLTIKGLSIQSLPAAGLPTSLRTLDIFRCPLLTERHRFETKSMWPEVSHIPHVFIDGKKLE